MRLAALQQQNPGVRLAKQTHASFVDTLFMKAHISTLDQEFEQARRQNIEQAAHSAAVSGDDYASAYEATIDNVADQQSMKEEGSDDVEDGTSSPMESGPTSGGITAGHQIKMEQNVGSDGDGQIICFEKKMMLGVETLQSENGNQSQSWGDDNSMHSDINESIGNNSTKVRQTEVSRRLETKHNSTEMIAKSIISAENTTAPMVARLSVNLSEAIDHPVSDTEPKLTESIHIKKIEPSMQMQAQQEQQPSRNVIQKRTSVISVTNLESSSPQAMPMLMPIPTETPQMKMDIMTKKTVRKGNTVINAISSKHWAVTDKPNGRRRRDNANSDLKQVEEATPRREIGTQKSTSSKLNSMIERSAVQSFSNDEDRTLTPNSQLFIFQGKFGERGSKFRQTQFSPTQTLPAETKMTLTTDPPMVIPVRNKVEVRNIDVGTVRNQSHMETELGTHQIGIQSTENNTNSEMKVRQGCDAAALMGSLLRQSQSGNNLPPDLNGNGKTLLEIDSSKQVKDHLQQASFQEKTKNTSILNHTEHSQQQQDDVVASDEYQSEDDEQVATRPSVQYLQVQEEKAQMILAAAQSIESGEKRRKRLLDGLTKEERLEIKQTMKLVYPNLALAQIKKERTKTVQPCRVNSTKAKGKRLLLESGASRLRKDQSPKTRTQRYYQYSSISPAEKVFQGATEPLNQLPSWSSPDERTFLQSQRQPFRGANALDTFTPGGELGPVDPRQMIFSQHVAQRTLLQLKNGKETSYGRFSKKPQMNRGFLQHNSVHIEQQEERFPPAQVSSQTTSHFLTADLSHVGCRNALSVPPSSHGQHWGGAGGPAIKIFDLPNIVPNEGGSILVGMRNSDDNSTQRSAGGNGRQHEMQIDPQLIEELTQNESMMQAQEAVIGRKKKLNQRQSGMSHKSRASEELSAKYNSDLNNMTNYQSGGGQQQQQQQQQWKVDDGNRPSYSKPKYSFDGTCFSNNHQHHQQDSSTGQRKLSSNQRWQVSHLGRDGAKPTSTKNNSRVSYMQCETPLKKVNVVNSGEVSLTNRHFLGPNATTPATMTAHENGGRPSRGFQFKLTQTRLQLKNGALTQAVTSPLAEAASPSKISATGESQLTNNSAEHYIRKPKLVSQLDLRRQRQLQEKDRSLDPSPVLWKPNMRTIAEGRAANNATLNSKGDSAHEVVSSRQNGLQAQQQLKLYEIATGVTEAQQEARTNRPRQSSHEEARFRPITSPKDENTKSQKPIDGLQVPEEELEVLSKNNQSTGEDANQGDSKTTKYLNLHSQLAFKDIRKMEVKVDTEKTLNFDDHSQNSLNNDLSPTRVLILNNSMPGASELKSSQNTASERVVNEQEGELVNVPFKITGKQVREQSNENLGFDKVRSLNTIRDQSTADFATNTLLKVKVQSTSPFLDCKSCEGTNSAEREHEKSPNTLTLKHLAIDSFPQLQRVEQSTSPIEPLSARIWGRVVNTGRGNMVSPKINVNKRVKKEDWTLLKIAPMTSYKRQLKTVDSGNNPHTCRYKDTGGGKLREFLVKECNNQLREDGEIGFKSEERPGVRLVNSNHIARLNYNREARHSSIQVLEGTREKLRTRTLAQMKEDDPLQNPFTQTMADHHMVNVSTGRGSSSKQQMMIQHSGLRESHHKKSQLKDRTNAQLKHQHQRGLHTQSLPSRNLTADDSSIERGKQLNSLERLQTFYVNEKKNQNAKQPYRKTDCKYVMQSTGQNLRKNLDRFYGMQPAKAEGQRNASVMDNQFATQQAAQNTGDHCFELKKVPIQRKEDGYIMSNLASPEESAFARRKLMTKQRKEYALKIQNENQQRHLEMSYQVSSPAAKMRTLIFAQQKKKNALAKATLSTNPVLYSDIDAMKTWQMSPR